MGAICSRRSAVDKSPSESTLNGDGSRDQDSRLKGDAEKAEEMAPPMVTQTMEKQPEEMSFSFPEQNAVEQRDDADGIQSETVEPKITRVLSNRSRPPKSNIADTVKTGATKVSEVSSIIGRAGTAGFGKAVEVLDTLGSSMTSLNIGAGFASSVSTKGNKISILAFEVANTIVKGSNLMQSLSKESIKHLKDDVLSSEGVELLISRDMDELLRIAASDKREELKVFSGEVVRFGNRCKDPQWHHLDRYFEKLGSELTPQKQLKEEAETIMQQLMTSVQYTAELYHELHALDRFLLDVKRKNQEDENPNTSQRGHGGETLQLLKQDLKNQKKHVKSLKKKSLWSKVLDEVTEKLVDIVHFLHLEIQEAFGSGDSIESVKGLVNPQQRLGPAGLSLHYANVIIQIDTLVSRSSSVPSNTRDALYQGLPPGIKAALRNQLQTFEVSEDSTVAQIKSEMEKTLSWLVPMANNTTKAHHGFGWVGEWANTGTEMNRKATGQWDLLRIETLHHADKGKTEAYILDLVVWLHHLILLSRPANGCGPRSPIKSPVRSPSQKVDNSSATLGKPSTPTPFLTKEDEEMLRVVPDKRFIPGISKSQEFKPRLIGENQRLSKSNSHSPSSGCHKELLPQVWSSLDIDIERKRALDVIDRVHMIGNP